MKASNLIGLGLFNLPENILYILALINGIICATNTVYFNHSNLVLYILDWGLFFLVMLNCVINRKQKSYLLLILLYFFGLFIVSVYRVIF